MREVELYRMTPDEEWEYAGLATWEDGGLEPVLGVWPAVVIRATEHYFYRRPSATHWEGSIGRERFRVVFRPGREG